MYLLAKEVISRYCSTRGLQYFAVFCGVDFLLLYKVIEKKIKIEAISYTFIFQCMYFRSAHNLFRSLNQNIQIFHCDDKLVCQFDMI